MLGKLLAQIGRRLNAAGASDSARRVARTHNPAAELADMRDANACNALGERYRVDSGFACECFKRAITLDAGFLAARFNLGNLYFGSNRIDDAAAQYEAILALDPDNPDALNNLGMILLQSGRASEAVTMMRRALKRRPDFEAAGNNLLFALTLAPEPTRDELLQEHLHYARRMHVVEFAAIAHSNQPDPQRRLRIGYVSADFKNHPVAWFMAGIVARHDARCCEVFCYSNWYKADAVTDAIKQHAHVWRQIDALNDADVAQLVRSDGIDILVDLSGHSSGGRLGVFALKPAPVQMTYIGYANTTGLSTIDYRITDSYGDPEETSDAYYVEKLIRMPACMWCYTPHENMPEVGAAPANISGHITFGSFNNASKINDDLAALWARVMSAVPNSRLIIACLPDGRTRARLRAIFAAHGIAESRLELMGRLSMPDFWSVHRRVDIALDSFPCNGGTTTCDTLWMGVPVVTRRGERFASRAGYSILANIGLNDLVARNDDEYVAIARALALDRARLDGLRAGLRPRLATSPLLDVARFTGHLEAAYRQAWATWCAGGVAVPLRIAAAGPP